MAGLVAWVWWAFCLPGALVWVWGVVLVWEEGVWLGQFCVVVVRGDPSREPHAPARMGLNSSRLQRSTGKGGEMISLAVSIQW